MQKPIEIGVVSDLLSMIEYAAFAADSGGSPSDPPDDPTVSVRRVFSVPGVAPGLLDSYLVAFEWVLQGGVEHG